MTTEKVVASKVVGSSNPIARKFRDIKSAFKGIGCGFILLVIGLGLIYYSVNGVKEYSKIVGPMPLQQTTELAENTLVKTTGTLSTDNTIAFEYSKCDEIFGCEYAAARPSKLDNLEYYSATFERFEVVKEVSERIETKFENGKEIEETIETTTYKEEWVKKGQAKENWASNIMLDEVKINPAEAKMMFEYASEEIDNIFIEELGDVPTYNQETSGEIGNTRVRVSYIQNPATETIVVGMFSNDEIDSGEPFIITDKTEAELVESLQQTEAMQKWGSRILAWLLLAAGFGMIIAPIMEFVEVIPVFGNLAKGAAGLAGAILAALIVLTGVLLLKYWAIILVLTVVLLGASIFLLVKVMSKAKSEESNE